MKISFRALANPLLVMMSALLSSVGQANAETASTTQAKSKSEQTVYVAIIIDDLGNSLRKGESFVAIPSPLTLAILPHTAHAKTLASAAHEAQKEVMIHMPMANINDKPIGPVD